MFSFDVSEAKVLIVLIAADSFDSLDRYHSFPPFLVQEAPSSIAKSQV